MTTETRQPPECPAPDNPTVDRRHVWNMVNVTRHARDFRCAYCGLERSESVDDMARLPYVQY